MHRNIEGITANDHFESTHADQYKNAQEWLTKTSESCSVLAVLVATVVFAAAYTVPGGVNEQNGMPVLLNSPLFMVFAVMDVASLSFSLTSVVMFLSILTSPFQRENFLSSLPRKLNLGLFFLFFSVITTMVTFTASILLTVRLGKHWTTTLFYAAALIPVMIFALIMFPWYSPVLEFFFKFVEPDKNALPAGRKKN